MAVASNQSQYSTLDDHNKKEAEKQAAEENYYPIQKTTKFLEHKNNFVYTEDDIDDFVSRGILTPYLPYCGMLYRVVDDPQHYSRPRSTTEIDGYITPSDRDIACQLGKLLSIEKISFLNVTIDHRQAILIDSGFIEYRSRWSDAPFESFETLGTFQKIVNEYQVISNGGRYKFSEETGIEIPFHVYRSHAAFHLSQLMGVSDMPRSATKTLFDTSINELNGATPTQKKGSKISRFKPAVLQAIIELGYDPIALPYTDKDANGLDGVRKEVRDYLARFEDTKDLTLPQSTFNNYYGILTRDGTLKEEVPPARK